MNRLKKSDYQLSITEVKDILKNQSKEELVKLVIHSYKTIPQLKEYISARYADKDKIEQIAEAYKDKMYDVFFPKSMRTQFKISDAKRVISDFKKLCSDKKMIIDLMLYYVEMGVEFTNTYGDIDESFYNSIEGMYEDLVNDINKCEDAETFKIYSDRLKAIVDNTEGIGWGFHDGLEYIYYGIKWLDLVDLDIDQSELINIKQYISNRLKSRNGIPKFNKEKSLDEAINDIIAFDEVFLSKIETQGFSNDDEHNFISERTGYTFELIELILWQKYCYEMENDYWTYDRGQCSKCGSSELYFKEVPNEDFEDKVICKKCGSEFIRA